MKITHLASLLKILAITAIFVLIQASAVCTIQQNQVQSPIAKEGILDLSSWNFEKDGPIPLDGEWEFYWQEHIVPNDFYNRSSTSTSNYINLPRFWNGVFHQGVELDGSGFATFRLTIKLQPGVQILGIRLSSINTASRLFANGKLIAEIGKAGRDSASTVPYLKPLVTQFKTDGDFVELVLHISNFHNRTGGMRQAITLGTATQISDLRNRALVFEFFLFGCILIMALYHLAHYILHRKGTSALHFSLFCFLIALRTGLTGERYLLYINSFFSWQLAAKVEIICYSLAVPAFAMFVNSVFPHKFSPKFLRLIQGYGLAGSAAFALLPLNLGTRTLPIYEIFTLLVILYIILVITLSIRDKREGAVIFALGFIVLFATSVNDILYDLGVLNTGFWLPLGVFIFILSQAILLSARFSMAFQRIEALSKELGGKSEELSRINKKLRQHKDTLGQKVIERTESIKTLLDNTGQCFLTFHSDYRIDPLYSKACQIFFSYPIQNKSVLELLSKGANLKNESGLKEMLDLVFEGVSSIELFDEVLPDELTIDNRILKTAYRVIPPAGTETQPRVMVILTDITLERELTRQIRQDEEHKAIIAKIAIDKAGFVEFVHEMNGYFSSLNNVLDSKQQIIDPNELFKAIHTIKGNSASYDLKPVTDLAHRIESDLDQFRNGTPLDTESLAFIKSYILSLENTFYVTLKSLNDVISPEELHSKERFYQVSNSKLKQLRSFLNQVISKKHQERLDHELDVIYKQPIAPILRRYKRTAEDIAGKLNKSIQVTLAGTETEVSMVRFERLQGTLVHLVRNCVDHGLESPDVRAASGKSMVGKLRIEIHESNGRLIIKIADDGCGIDSEQIKNLAVIQGIITESQASEFNEKQLLSLIFEPGLTTVEEVSGISGRGVGMDAVQGAVAEHAGTIDIQTKIGIGTTFIVEVPV